jgi:hypothetical protein
LQKVANRVPGRSKKQEKTKGPKQVKTFSIKPIEKGKKKMMKQWQAPLSKAPSKRGKEEQRLRTQV